MSHANNPDLINRLKRAQGHMATIVRMVEEGRDGLLIAQQMLAVIKAVEKAKALLIADHIEHHLEAVVGPLPRETRERLSSLNDIAKYI
jgi:DNA-binding FrmR family transcriptional regulator